MARKKQKEENLDVTPDLVEESAADAAGEEGTVETEATSAVDELAAAVEEARKNWDLYLRGQAEMENFRKRMQREKQDTARFANETILRDILPVIDNLERAVEHARENDGDSTGLFEGVEMTLSQFAGILTKFGVTPVETVGRPFDPACHEAMGQMVSTEHPPNAIAQEFQKGYRLHERLLRPALVMIAKAPEGPAAEDLTDA